MSNHFDDRIEQIENFDPNSSGIKGNLFGLPFSPSTAQVIILPVPWEVTVSYNGGTSCGPLAINEASIQVDLYQKGIKEAWKTGIAMLPISEQIEKENEKFRNLALTYLNHLDKAGYMNSEEGRVIPRAINDICHKVNIFVESEAQEYLADGKIVGILGGDHSTPLGLMKALTERNKEFGILQIDAHADLRKAYENFVYSHASIMYNALKLPQVSKLVQVGVRDLCDEEVLFIDNHPNRVSTFYMEDIESAIFQGSNWDEITDLIIQSLPEKVYISFDIDGLDPSLCPGTGTPVPGGLTYYQATHLIKKLVKSGKKIIGFDLSEVSPSESEWDANVGARVLYFLSNWAAASQGMVETTV